jgi:hypothetical protein
MEKSHDSTKTNKKLTGTKILWGSHRKYRRGVETRGLYFQIVTLLYSGSHDGEMNIFADQT